MRQRSASASLSAAVSWPASIVRAATSGSRGSGMRRRRWSIARLRVIVIVQVSRPARSGSYSPARRQTSV